MDLANLKNKSAKITFKLDGEEVNIEFHPHRLTPEYRAGLQRLAQDETDEEPRDSDAQMLSDLLIKWDVMAGGEPYPPTYENLLTAPQSLVTRTALEILEAVGKLATPKKSKK